MNVKGNHKKEVDVHVTLLEKFSGFLKNLSENQIRELRRGEKELSISLKKKKTNGKRKVAGELHASTDSRLELQKVHSELLSANSREVGNEILRVYCPTRTRLQALAKIIDIPISKNDSMESIRMKIIESTIGFRIRSNAIREENKYDD